MNICFDNSFVFNRNIYYFDYKGVRFKLIQNNSYKWADVLLTIIPDYKQEIEERIFLIAADFFSALAWQDNSIIKFWEAGGRSARNSFKLRNAKCRIFDFHECSLAGCYLHGNNLYKIADIETEEQRNALILFREANSSNNIFLSFLFYWQIIETGGNNSIEWVNTTYENNFSTIKNLGKEDIDRLPLNGLSLGNYFHEDCRNAIAHIRRWEGRSKIKLDNPEDTRRMYISTKIAKEFARTYIKDKLLLNKYLYLMRYRGKGFPIFVKQEERMIKPYSIAYPLINKLHFHKMKW